MHPILYHSETPTPSHTQTHVLTHLNALRNQWPSSVHVQTILKPQYSTSLAQYYWTELMTSCDVRQSAEQDDLA